MGGVCGETNLEPGSSHPTASPPTHKHPRPRAPHPATKPVALPLPAWQAAWPGPFSKEAHFLPPRARLDEPELPIADGQTPASICIHRPGLQSPLPPSTEALQPLTA